MVSKIFLFRSCASGLSKGYRIRMKASARPWTPMPMGLWRLFEYSAWWGKRRKRTCSNSTRSFYLWRGNNDRYLWYRVVVNINDLVQVTSDNLSREKRYKITNSCCSKVYLYTHTDLCNFTQPLEVILSLWSHETVEGEGGKVADCHLSKDAFT